ncbi:hypothetical protein CKO51_30930 [Rhodopirellula sp. SM50]|nr:hypothetical protein CKO51_30930 [Rhodopirellula sp. SM50]
MAIGIDPTVDFACKRLLGSPDHPAITLHFLNAVLGGHPPIANVQILNPIIGKSFDDDKASILDVLATDDHGRFIDIEIQTTLPAGLSERLTYYAASQLVEQLGEGDGYRRIAATTTRSGLFRSDRSIGDDCPKPRRKAFLRITVKNAA